MSNLAEKLPRLVKEKLEDVDSRRRELVGRLDSWVDEKLPKAVVEPIRNKDGLSVDNIKDAAYAAGDEFVSFLRARWTVLRGGQAEGTPVETPAVKKPAAKKPAAKKPAAKKPAAKKPAVSTSRPTKN